MQQPEDINHIYSLNAADAEHDKVSALAPVSIHMERLGIVADFGERLDPDGSGTGIQSF